MFDLVWYVETWSIDDSKWLFMTHHASSTMLIFLYEILYETLYDMTQVYILWFFIGVDSFIVFDINKYSLKYKNITRIKC